MIAQIQQKAEALRVSESLVIGEILQIVFLDALYQYPAANDVFFQGGTSLRLLHHGWRFSEDLDFATLVDGPGVLEPLVRASFKRCQRSLAQLWGSEAFILRLKRSPPRSRLDSFWIILERPGARRRDRVRLEFARFPVRQPQLFTVKRTDLDLPILPLIVAESLPELLADKITAIARRPYLKGRDWFDLWYLTRMLEVKPQPDLIDRKFSDYRLANPYDRLGRNVRQATAELVGGEMEKFLPEPYRSRLAADGFRQILDAVRVTTTAIINNR